MQYDNMKNKKIDEPLYEHEHGRWMCPTDNDAYNIIEKHPGDPVYRYDRDKNNHIINIRAFWNPNMPDTHKLPTIRNGKIRKKT